VEVNGYYDGFLYPYDLQSIPIFCLFFFGIKRCGVKMIFGGSEICFFGSVFSWNGVSSHPITECVSNWWSVVQLPSASFEAVFPGGGAGRGGTGGGRILHPRDRHQIDPRRFIWF
jgi:hypothetical protein